MSQTIAENYHALQESIRTIALQCGRTAEEIALVAVTKNRPAEDIDCLYQLGQRAFAESRPKEMLEKQELTPLDIEWHFIGNLQRKMARKVVGKCCLIHSITSYEIAEKVSRCSADMGLTTDCLLEVNTSQEVSKLGLSAPEWRLIFEKILKLPSINIAGLMTMAPLLADAALAERKASSQRSFAALRHFRDQLLDEFNVPLPHLSMGMSQDYAEAIQEGATILRVGSLLFASEGTL